jgi:ribonucleoside-triphosphate reductase
MVLFAVVGELGCHSEDTQIFTPNGIKTFDELNAGDFVFGVDEKGIFKKTQILDKFQYDYNGKMYNFKSLRYDFLVTPNHKMIFKKWWRKQYEYTEAQKTNVCGNFLSQFYSEGKRKEMFNIYDYIVGKKNNIKEIPTDDFLKLTAWYISDGNIVGAGKNLFYVQIRKPKHIKEIEELVKSMGFSYGIYEKSKIVIFERDLGSYFYQGCGRYSPNKRIPDEIMELNREHLIHLLKTLFKGDGCYNHTYYTTSEKLMKDFMILCYRLGFQPRLTKRFGRGGIIRGKKIKSERMCYEIHVSFSPRNYFNPYGDKRYGTKNLFTIDYNGKVWCFKTETDNFFTIRNGKIGLSGNSGKTLSLTYLAWKGI